MGHLEFKCYACQDWCSHCYLTLNSSMTTKRERRPKEGWLPQQPEWSVKYARARSQAHYRGEAWEFEPQEWLDMWLAVVAQPGRGLGTACMTRLDRGQPWSKDNCEIVRRSRQPDTTGLRFQYAVNGYVN